MNATVLNRVKKCRECGPEHEAAYCLAMAVVDAEAGNYPAARAWHDLVTDEYAPTELMVYLGGPFHNPEGTLATYPAWAKATAAALADWTEASGRKRS
ncbi:MAG: hypothetical protein AAF589_04710 [Planctomycetota bacterium]